ncbi:MAG: insulinase family protein [Clostridia bacterium]|nr:insulinase family protein [Clostridia bacterium]
MQQMIRKTLGDGVQLTIVPSARFKTSVMSACLVLPLGGEEASARAALPRVLRRGTAAYPDMQQLGAALDELYGARIEPIVRKRGESLILGFLADVIDEKYAAADDTGLTARAVDLLASFWQTPYIKDGAFAPEYVASEKENLADRIEALKNDPRSYALRRLHEVMCEGEAFGLSEYGTAPGARALTPKALYAAYRHALEDACIELFYCGSMPPDTVEDAFSRALTARSQGTYAMPRTEVRAQPAGEVRTVVEEMNVRQGKLSLGFRTGVTGADEDYAALMLLNNAFGGSTSSRLFLNVREKRSLCYYASSTLERQKGILSVTSGIENENFEVARDEILRQLADLQSGGLTDEEVETARRTVRSALRSMQDSPVSLQQFWLGQAVEGLDWDVDALVARIERVTRAEMLAVAGKIKLDTIYFLKGVGA